MNESLLNILFVSWFRFVAASACSGLNLDEEEAAWLSDRKDPLTVTRRNDTISNRTTTKRRALFHRPRTLPLTCRVRTTPTRPGRCSALRRPPSPPLPPLHRT